MISPDWTFLPSIEPPPDLLAAAGGNALVARALLQRGYTDAASARAFLNPACYTPPPPSDLPGLEQAVERLRLAIQSGETILVWGDFDVDGQTATAVLVSALRGLGGRVIYHIPVRERESHGVSVSVLQSVLAQGADLLLTCDTGITAHDACDYAQKVGIPVIITDHHEVPPSLPQAFAILNPRLIAQAGHPFSGLPGVGVAYKLAEALYLSYGRPAECAALLDLVALGIVADLAPVIGEARCLLQRGLVALRHTQRPGLLALYEQAELKPDLLTEEHISFSLAPRLNALGRLGDANPAVEFLITQDAGAARLQALELESFNVRRKLLTSQVYQGAVAQVEQDPTLLDEGALVVAHAGWPAGVLGIVASRLVDRYGRPAIVLTMPVDDSDETLARGSARSVEGVNITAAIAEQAPMLHTFGGHPMAAGLSLPASLIPTFRRQLGRSVKAQLGERPARPPLQIDAELGLADLTLEQVAAIESLAPFGPGNPPLVFAACNLRLLNATPLGREEEHLAVLVEDEAGQTGRVLWWGGALLKPALSEGRFDLAFTARTSTYNGHCSVQLEWVSWRPAAGAEAEELERPPLEVVDHRLAPHPLPLLRELLGLPGVQVWAEGDAPTSLAESGSRGDSESGMIRSRLALTPCDTLVIWTTPPGPAELAQAIEAARPRQLVLFGISPQPSQAGDFLSLLAGTVKYALAQKDGAVNLNTLAAATAQRPAAVRKGLAWLARRGYIRTAQADGPDLHLVPGEGQKQPGLEEAAAQLEGVLAETAAYRQYFHLASAESLTGGASSA